MSSSFPIATILGYPRVGRNRELKKATESFWAGKISEAELEATAAGLRAGVRERLAALGLSKGNSAIPESFSFYDQVLDVIALTGAVPARFAHLIKDGKLGLAEYFTVARGVGDDAPLEMTKWFDTNYHYLVPEIGPDTKFAFTSDRIVRQFEEAKAQGFVTRPVVVGPVTFLMLAKAADGATAKFSPLSRLDDVLPVYVQLLERLAAVGAQWIQIDEPGLVNETIDIARSVQLDALRKAYDVLGSVANRPQLFVAAPYGSLGDAADVLADSAVEAIGFDLVKGKLPNSAKLADKTLVAGVINGRNIWRGDLVAAFKKLDSVKAVSSHVTVATSTSLQHVPHDVAAESKLDSRLKSWLAFADQKVEQVVTLARGLSEGESAIANELAAATAALADREAAPGVKVPAVRERLAALTPSDFSREDYQVRHEAQLEAFKLPPLPTTTIGSFPQTAEIRRARAQHGKGELSDAQYLEAMRDEIRHVVKLQEDLDIDVLVHGEPERNDMVQYFAELLDGFSVTENGWVQSYGTRCTRPSILWGDVSRPAPMTVEWSTFTQSLTDRPVKGMLTGPVTILAWSFVRDDQPIGDTARQVALALRDEIHDLEAAGITMIQVDEPALRELLPLEKSNQAAYLDWSVGSFKLSTAGVEKSTQIHTHLCYSEFGVVIDAIRGLDADVTSIEAARSRMEVVDELKTSGFDSEVGPGVYDIHSPRVPSQNEVHELLERAVKALPVRQLWVNPDCGLKTRGYDETVASLKNIVAATKAVRAELA